MCGPKKECHLDDYLSSLTGQPLPKNGAPPTIPESHSMSQSWSPALSTGQSLIPVKHMHSPSVE